MSKGKDICKELKAVRKRIAEENGIPLEIKECTYEGPCRGTCPRCESEVRYLENELAKRIKLGKVAKVAGLALTLAVSNGAKAQSVTPTPDSSLAEGTAGAEQQTGVCEVTGVVVDAKTREPLPFVQVMLYKDTTKAHVVQTDFDGRYRFNVRRGNYTLVARCTGYSEYRREVKVKRTKQQCFMELVHNYALYDTYDSPRVDTVGLETPMMGLVAVAFETEGTVIDSKTKETLPFVNVLVLKNGKLVKGATTDFDGCFKLDLEEGEYEFVFSAVGYARKNIPVKVPNDMPLKAIELEPTAEPLEGILIEGGASPIIEIGPEGNTHTEINGVPLLIQY